MGFNSGFKGLNRAQHVSSMRMPKTCRAVFKWQVKNLRSCCIWLVDSVESMIMKVNLHLTGFIYFLLKALQLQRSFGLLNEFFPFCPLSYAVLPVLLFSSLLYRSLHHPPIYVLAFLAILLVRVTTHVLFVYHAVVWRTMYVSEPS